MNLLSDSLSHVGQVPVHAIGLLGLAGAGAWCLWQIIDVLGLRAPQVTHRPLMTQMERRTIRIAAYQLQSQD